MKKQNIIDEYLNALRTSSRYLENTLISYKKDIMAFFVFLEDENMDFRTINYSDIKKYLVRLNDKKLKRKTICRHIVSLRKFYNYLVKNKIIKINPFLNIEVRQNEHYLPNFNTCLETEDVINGITLNSFLDIRDKFIIELLYSTGIRVSEAINIKKEHINFTDKIIKISGKGDKQRYVVYGEYLEELLDKYLVEWDKTTKTAYIIINKNGYQITSRSINNIIYKRNNSPHHMSAHTFRHSFATDIINNGADLKTTQFLLGHSSLKTTDIYTHTSKQKVREDYLKAHPRAFKE